MTDSILDRAKSVARLKADETNLYIRLSFFEDMIAEIERLQHRVDVLSEEHPAHKLRAIKLNAEERSKEEGKP